MGKKYMDCSVWKKNKSWYFIKINPFTGRRIHCFTGQKPASPIDACDWHETDLTGDIEKCRNLWRAVLEQALHDLCEFKELIRKSSNNNRSAKDCLDIGNSKKGIIDLIDWFESDAYNVGTFLWICDVIDISSECIAERIRNEKITISLLEV
jgi:hypothetical protein